MKLLRVVRDGVVLLDCVQLANTFRLRLTGLLGAPESSSGGGLLISPGSAVHTLGMRYPIDVIFLTREGVVKKTTDLLLPGRWAIAAGASQILELRAGVLAEHNIRVNEILRLEFYHESP